MGFEMFVLLRDNGNNRETEAFPLGLLRRINMPCI